MENIIIAGYTVAELTKLQQAVKKDASKIIADAVDDAEGKVRQIIVLAELDGELEEGDKVLDFGVIRALGESAAESYNLAKLISGISGVEYFVQYDEEYRESDGTLSTKLHEIFDYEYPAGVEEVMDVLEEMEHQSYLWNSSSIGC